MRSWVTRVDEECGRDPTLDREMMPRECEPLKRHKGSKYWFVVSYEANSMPSALGEKEQGFKYFAILVAHQSRAQ